jgi:hypothetical protein
MLSKHLLNDWRGSERQDFTMKWKDGWKERRKGKERQMVRWTEDDGWMHGCMNRWMDGQDGWIDG